jgi:hypothetical protein
MAEKASPRASEKGSKLYAAVKRTAAIGAASFVLSLPGAIPASAVDSISPPRAAADTITPTLLPPQQRGTLTFVVKDWFSAMYNTKFMDECPAGLTLSNDELWWRGISKEERAKDTNNGLVQALARGQFSLNRGPHHEDVCFNPTVVKDPPMETVKGKFSYGANLDGTTDGHATSKSCAHEKFTGVDGTPAVDNQFYRVLGCAYGWRKQVGRHIEDNANEARRTSGLAMILVEITGVTDPRNSDNVTVTFYRSIDQYPLNASGEPLPYSSYRIQTKPDGKPMFGDSLKGSIKDGVLTTERGNVTLPFYGNYTYMHPEMRDMGLRLEIAADGQTAKGQVTGYYDAEAYLYYLEGQGFAATIHGDSCPALYDAFHKYADGYPDPKTGQCTMLSSAWDLTAYAAFAVHPEDRGERKTAQR